MDLAVEKGSVYNHFLILDKLCLKMPCFLMIVV